MISLPGLDRAVSFMLPTSSTRLAITSDRASSALTSSGHGRSPRSIGVSVARTAALRASERLGGG